MTFSTAYDGWESYMENTAYNSWEDVLNEYRTYTKRWNESIEKSVNSIFTKKNQRYELIASNLTVLSIITAFFEEPFSTAYSFIQSPLLLHATEPKELHAAREKGIAQLRKDIKNDAIISIEDAGHMIQWDQPEEVSAEIVRWIHTNEVRHLKQ